MKIKFKTKEEAPEGFREFLKEANGEFELDVAPKGRLDAFRENNIAVSKERDTLKETLTAWTKSIGKKKDGGDYTPEEFAEHVGTLTQTAQQVADGKLKATSDIEVELASRTKAMKETLEAQLATASGESTRWKKQAEEGQSLNRQMTIDNAISQVAGTEKIGLNMTALPDVLHRGRALFVVEEDGKIVPKKDGVIIRGEDGVSPMTIEEWFNTDLRKTASYYFKPSAGGNASGGDGAGSASYGGFSKEEFDKLSPERRLAIANSIPPGRKKG